MTRTLHKLKDSALHAAVNKDVTLHDGGGLYFVSTATGAASFHYRYQINKRTTKMGLGPYPTVSLADAREQHKYWQRLKSLGRDPKTVRDAERASSARNHRTVDEIFKKFFETHKRSLKGEGEAGRWWSPVKHHVLPHLGDETVETLTVDKIVAAFPYPPSAARCATRIAPYTLFLSKGYKAATVTNIRGSSTKCFYVRA